MMRHRRFLTTLCLFVALALFGTTDPAEAKPESISESLFRDVSRVAGIVGTRQGNDRAIGQAWGDYDRDGWVDFYVTDTRGPNTLFRNNGDGTFTVPSAAAAVTLPESYSGGASFADYDNDGWLDLYVVNWGANVLFHNEAGQGFRPVTGIAGVGDEANGQTASWGDFDNDGWLDLYVANWSCYPRCGRPSSGDNDRLYRNNGDGTFSDVTHYLGGYTNGAGFVASFTDFDNDGDQDIYLVNDEFLFPIGNMLWRNDGPGCDGHCFTEIGADAGANTRVMGMGLATADYDNDGDFDFYFSNAGPMTLLQNQGDGTFRDMAALAGVEQAGDIAWATTALDYDNDGWQDLYLAVMTSVDHRQIPANPLFHNNGDGTFSRVENGGGAADVGPTMGVATADFDRDGWVDLLLGNKDDGYKLLHNQGGDISSAHWLTLELVGGGPVNRDAVGARVVVETADGLRQLGEVRNGGGLGAGHELALHFGLGENSSISRLLIRWPNGREQSFSDIDVDRRLQLMYPLDGEAEASQQAALYPASAPASHTLPPQLAELGLTVLAMAGLALFAWLIRPVTFSWGWLRGATLTLGLALSLLAVSAAAHGPVTSWQAPEKQLARLLDAAGATPPTLLPVASAAQIQLGEALFWDPILSGNGDTSCATCHHPTLGTGDGLALSIGTNGRGLGPERTPARQLIPRNASPIYNLGFAGMNVLFWDGRVSGSAAAGFDSPANDDLPFNLTDAIAVQAMFPVTSRDEMRGNPGDQDIHGGGNELARLKDYQWPLIWDGLLARLLAIPSYQQLFTAAYPDTPLAELSFGHAANALAAYQMATFTFTDAPWDRYLQGDQAALTPEALQGAILFYGEAGCAECHAGPLLTDLQFYNLGVPQIGPGKGFEEPLDYGRARESGDTRDLFAFRTPPLRDVAITGPWMHNGAFLTLEATIRHHLNPAASAAAYDLSQLSPLVQAESSNDPAVLLAALQVDSFQARNQALDDNEIQQLLAFLAALTSPYRHQHRLHPRQRAQRSDRGWQLNLSEPL